MAGKGTPAIALLTKRRVPHQLHTYEPDARAESYGAEAVAALDQATPGQVFKTLVAEVDGTLTVGVIPVTHHLDLKAIAAARAGKKAVMAEIASAERATGYVAGGISPLGQRRRLPIVLDSSATGFEMIFCSAGRRGLEIEISPTELIRLVDATLADIASG